MTSPAASDRPRDGVDAASAPGSAVDPGPTSAPASVPEPRTASPAGAHPVSAEAPSPDAVTPDGPSADLSAAEALGDLRRRAVEARARLRPERVAIPAPRSPGGVWMPVLPTSDPHRPAADLVAAADALVADLTALERTPDDPAHHALARIAELTRAGVPEQGWSAAEELAVEALEETAALAGRLAHAGAALLERLDADDRPSPAVVVDALATSLRVTAMVAELEVFARAR